MLSREARCLGPVVQSIISLMISLRGQLVKYFTTLYFVEKNEKSFCTAKASHIFSTKKYWHFQIHVLTYEILTKRQ